MRKQDGDLTHISPALGTYTVFLLAFLSPGRLPLHVKRIAGQTKQRCIFLFNPLYKAPAPGEIGKPLDYFLQYGPKCILCIF